MVDGQHLVHVARDRDRLDVGERAPDRVRPDRGAAERHMELLVAHEHVQREHLAGHEPLQHPGGGARLIRHVVGRRLPLAAEPGRAHNPLALVPHRQVQQCVRVGRFVRLKAYLDSVRCV